MAYTPLLADDDSPRRHLSKTVTGSKVFGNQLLRDNFTIQSWLLMGAFLQGLLFLLPIRPIYAFGPVVLLGVLQLANNLALIVGLKRNEYVDGVIEGKSTAVIPGRGGEFEGEDGFPGGRQVCFFMLTLKSNHPLGIYAPGFPTFRSYFKTMIGELERDAERWGFLGSSNWLNATDRAAASELMVAHYFRSKEDLHRFAHAAETHRKGWDWWIRVSRQHKHLAIMHEVIEAPPKCWETLYINCKPTGFGATSHPVADKEGGRRWVRPVVDAKKGPLRTMPGRMGWDEGAANSGAANEKYGNDDYGAV